MFFYEVVVKSAKERGFVLQTWVECGLKLVGLEYNMDSQSWFGKK